MNFSRALSILMLGAGALTGCGDDDETDPKDGGPVGTEVAVLDLNDIKTNPTDYDAWFDFRPNVKKYILAGAPETEHIAILWYTVSDGSVGLHYHSKTESVYVIDGTQTDAKGAYPTGTVYFNPPESGHAISESSGFFLLAYASPPDFMQTDLIQEYTPIRIDTDDPDLTTTYPFDETAEGVGVFAPPLDPSGGMSAAFIDTASAEAYDYVGNYLVVIEGSCSIDGEIYGEEMLVVTKTIEPKSFAVAAQAESRCLALGVSF